MVLEKVYDELMAQIEDLKKAVARDHAQSVEITSSYNTGLKIADYEINGSEGSLKVPYPEMKATDTQIGVYDGKPIYEKLITLETGVTLSQNTWVDLTEISGDEYKNCDVYSCIGYTTSASGLYSWPLSCFCRPSDGGISVLSNRVSGVTIDKLYLRYVRNSLSREIPAEAKLTRKSKSTK